MDNPDEAGRKSTQLALKVVQLATPTERELLFIWARSLTDIRASNLSSFEKLKQAISVTAKSPSIFPILKMAFREVEKIVWTDRGVPARFAITAAVAALTLTGSGAGIAALGGAIGLPLWVVFGAGGAFIGTILDEASKVPKGKK